MWFAWLGYKSTDAVFLTFLAFNPRFHNFNSIFFLSLLVFFLSLLGSSCSFENVFFAFDSLIFNAFCFHFPLFSLWFFSPAPPILFFFSLFVISDAKYLTLYAHQTIAFKLNDRFYVYVCECARTRTMGAVLGPNNTIAFQYFPWLNRPFSLFFSTKIREQYFKINPIWIQLPRIVNVWTWNASEWASERVS